MAITLNFYTDANLTTLVPDGKITAEQNADGSTPPVDFRLWVGSTVSNRRYRDNVDPGVNPILLSVTDANPGSGHEAAEVRLATSQIGLDGATPGAALNLGAQILSGAANAVEVWIRVDDATGTVGTATELGIATQTLREEAI